MKDFLKCWQLLTAQERANYDKAQGHIEAERFGILGRMKLTPGVLDLLRASAESDWQFSQEEFERAKTQRRMTLETLA